MNKRLALLVILLLVAGCSREEQPNTPQALSPASTTPSTNTPEAPVVDESTATPKLTATPEPPATPELAITSNILVPQGKPATIDGLLSPGEWDSALAIDLADGTLLLMVADDYLYLGIDSDRLGLGSLCVQWQNNISILHSSAALGTATYVKDGQIWRKTRDFTWTNRDTSNSPRALAERQEHLERENWLASNGRMGHRNEMEYQIAMEEGELLLGVTYLLSPEYENTDFWPETMGSVCRHFTPAPDGPPEEANFAPESWMTLIAAEDPHTCPEGLPSETCKTLQSLKKVDEYPLYTMVYYRDYRRVEEMETTAGRSTKTTSRLEGPAWGCSLFAAFAGGEDGLFGRNFDWQFSPAVLLFTDPPDGYASVSMVDIAYLFSESEVDDLDNQPLEARLRLLETPFWPFDGMNEHGLAVGMAAVPAGQGAPDPDKDTVDSLMVMRLMLDEARNVEEALEIFTSYNIDMGGGPPLHYLVADASGRSVLLEFYQGELVVLPGDKSWQQMTNFLRASAGDSAEGQCWRYDLISQRLEEKEGSLSRQEAIDLLAGVAQDNTQWSILYGMNSGEIWVTVDRHYETIHRFQLEDYQPAAP